MAIYLRRYTDLPALIYLLRERKITLLDPESWDDQNDSYFLTLYRENRKMKAVLALCFTETSETYHHWRVFANGSSGICVRFERRALVAALRRQPGVTTGRVKYLTLDNISKRDLDIEELPFLKRYPYEDEHEFRAIYESKTTKVRSLDIPIALSCIDRITLSPWMPSVMADHVRRTIRTIDGCKALKIARSTLVSNEEWKEAGERAW
jgi:hypothetical protein